MPHVYENSNPLEMSNTVTYMHIFWGLFHAKSTIYMNWTFLTLLEMLNTAQST